MYGCSQFRSGDGGKDDLDPIPHQIGENPDGKSSRKGQFHLQGKPCGAEEIAHSHAQDHADDSGCILPGERFHQESLYQRKEEKPDEVSAGGTGKFSQPAAEGRKYRKPGCAEAEIDKEAYCASFYSEQIDGKENGKVCESDRHRAERERDGQRTQDADHSGHEPDQRELSGACFRLLRQCVSCFHIHIHLFQLSLRVFMHTRPV